ncbi:MAG: hypothetical protein WBG67_03230, partial [Thermoanaerobaculia bacterium]
MSRDSSPLDLDALAPEAATGIRMLPVVHERLEMTAVVRAVLDQLEPTGVALELPTTLAETVSRAVRRLPRISIIVSEEPGEDALVWVVAPGDPFAEALRWAAERERPVFFIDPDLPYREAHRDPVPDPYSIWHLGAEAYMGLLEATSGAAPVEESDRQREAGMAFHVVSARDKLPGGELLVLVGAAHSRRL